MAFNLQAFLKTHKDAAKKDLWGDDLQTYVTSHEGDWDSKPDNLSSNINKTSDYKPPKPEPKSKPEPKPKSELKPKPTSTSSERSAGRFNLPNVDLGTISQITETIKKKVTATDLSGGHSLNTDQDLTKVDLSGGHSLNTTQDLSGGHSLNTEQDLSGGHSLNTKPFGNKNPQSFYKTEGSTDLLQEIGDADQFDLQAFLAPYLEAAKKGLPPPGVKITMPKVDLGSVSQLTEKIKTEGSAAVDSIKTEGTKATDQIKTETGKLVSGDFNLKDAVTGTTKGASTTIKESDAGTGVTLLTEKIKNTDITDPQINTNPLGDTKVDLGSLSQFTEKIKTDVGGGFEELKENIDTTYKGSTLNTGLENVQKEGQKAITQIKQEGQKLLTGDFNLENAVKGTISGIEDTYKGSDAHSVLQQVEDFVKDPTKGIRNYASDVKDEGEAVINQYKKAGGNIVTTGQNIGTAFEDTFNTGMNVSTALGSNAAKQVMKAKSDLTSAFGGLTGAGPKSGKTTSIGTLLERDRDKRRGGLSRSGTSRTLITGKY